MGGGILPGGLSVDRGRLAQVRAQAATLLDALDEMELCEAAAHLSMTVDALDRVVEQLGPAGSGLAEVSGAEQGSVGDQGDVAAMEAHRQLEGAEPGADGTARIVGAGDQALEPWNSP